MALRDELGTQCGEVDLIRDRLLVERSQSGDSSAFGELYTQYHDRLCRFCFRRLHDDHESEDVAQEAFARAWRALPTFAGERHFYPWLTVVAGNLCTDVLRKRARGPQVRGIDTSRASAEPPAADDPEEAVLSAVDVRLVAEALGRLSDRHRRILAMREGSGWTYQEIATHEGVEVSTIETLLWRARRAFRRAYIAVSGEGALGGLALLARSVRLWSARITRHLGTAPIRRAGLAAAALTSVAAGTMALLPARTSPSASARAPEATVNGPAGGPTPARPAPDTGAGGLAGPVPSAATTNGAADTAAAQLGSPPPAAAGAGGGAPRPLPAPPPPTGSGSPTVPTATPTPPSAPGGSPTNLITTTVGQLSGTVGQVVSGGVSAVTGTVSGVTSAVGTVTSSAAGATAPVVSAVTGLIPSVTSSLTGTG